MGVYVYVYMDEELTETQNTMYIIYSYTLGRSIGV